MATREREKKEAEDEQMTEAQRLTLLEKSMSLNRFFLLLLAMLIVVTLSVTITVSIISAMDGGDTAKTAEIVDLQNKVQELRQELQATREQVATLNAQIPAMKTAIANGSAPAFQRLLLKQEASYQEFIRGVKEGMYDLARMVPGSRTWLELYNEKMDRALQLSQERQRELQRLNTGGVLVEPGG
ncbi:hypothetical protein HCH_01007 [Hahella chejuensis KCTC 2396]|uniref:Uncharacterized protein n=1 Tax=Hahella chejuensis (strain KCTC 2396) TaxID=349521 RepID=Q2SN82_HAHCH|nr:hypothetical protein [Hahella chejuensis]ABC27892.1 hypothetical protein HCH_01007 [Hahella chejuensis KCTC 2396]